ncbi:MAG: hypothetical protein JNJ59_17280, partial [Deltaproteobacteria bacterium]|nr:hypothetical protein [Deltaproteobacteria bacterium]
MAPSPSDLRAFSLVACLVLVGRTALELLIPRSQGALLDLAYHLGHMFDVSLAAVLFGRALASASRLALVGGFVVIGVFVVRDLGHVVALPAAQHLEALRGVGFALGSAA